MKEDFLTEGITTKRLKDIIRPWETVYMFLNIFLLLITQKKEQMPPIKIIIYFKMGDENTKKKNGVMRQYTIFQFKITSYGLKILLYNCITTAYLLIQIRLSLYGCQEPRYLQGGTYFPLA